MPLQSNVLPDLAVWQAESLQRWLRDLHANRPLNTDQEIITHTQETLDRMRELAVHMRTNVSIWTTAEKPHPLEQDTPEARKVFNRARAKTWQPESPAAARARGSRLILEGAQDSLKRAHPTYEPRPTFQHHDREPAPGGLMAYCTSAHLQKGQSGLSRTDFLGGDEAL